MEDLKAIYKAGLEVLCEYAEHLAGYDYENGVGVKFEWYSKCGGMKNHLLYGGNGYVCKLQSQNIDEGEFYDCANEFSSAMLERM